MLNVELRDNYDTSMHSQVHSATDGTRAMANTVQGFVPIQCTVM